MTTTHTNTFSYLDTFDVDDPATFPNWVIDFAQAFPTDITDGSVAMSTSGGTAHINVTLAAGGGLEADGGYGKSVADYVHAIMPSALVFCKAFTFTVPFRISGWAFRAGLQVQFTIGSTHLAFVEAGQTEVGDFWTFAIDGPSGGDSVGHIMTTFDPGTHWIELQWDGSNLNGRIWLDGDDRPDDPTLTYPEEAGLYDASMALYMSGGTEGSGDPVDWYGEEITDGIVEYDSVSLDYELPAAFSQYARDRIILSIRSSFTDDNLYNHALVVASGDKDHTYYSELSDTDPLSPTRISALGDRLFVYESATISTQDAADMAVQKVFRDNCVVSEDLEMDVLCNPALEGNDIVSISEAKLSKLSSTFRIRGLTIPFSSSRQTLRLGRVINIP